MNILIALGIALAVFMVLRFKISYSLFLIFIAIIFLRSGIFIVNEGSQVVLTQFEKIIAKPYTKAGLYVKIPLLWKANYFDKRILSFNDYQIGVVTKDKYTIDIDSVANWKIIEADVFYETFGDIKSAEVMIKNIIGGAIRQMIAEHDIDDLLSNRDEKEKLDLNSSNKFIDIHLAAHFDTLIGQFAKPEFSRQDLNNKIIKNVSEHMEDTGVEVLNVFLTDIKYEQSVVQQIMQRMVLGFYRDATELRAEGMKAYQRILGKIEKERVSILAPAQKTALEIKGKAEEEITKIYAESFGKDEDFYKFWRSMQAYEESIPYNSSGMIFSTDSDFLNYLNRLSPNKNTNNKQQNESKTNDLLSNISSKEQIKKIIDQLKN